MAFTLDQYNALTEAYALGATSVSYGDKTVTYRSLKEMQSIIQLIESKIFPENKPNRRRLADYNKGIYPDL